MKPRATRTRADGRHSTCGRGPCLCTEAQQKAPAPQLPPCSPAGCVGEQGCPFWCRLAASQGGRRRSQGAWAPHPRRLWCLTPVSQTNKDYTEGKLPELIDIIIESGATLFISAVGVPPRWAVDKVGHHSLWCITWRSHGFCSQLHEAGIAVMNMIGAPKHVKARRGAHGGGFGALGF